MLILLLSLAACDLLDPEQVGAFTCDEYCDQVVGKTEECAAEQSKEVDEFAAEGREDWAGATATEMIASCNDDLESAGKSDTECQAETTVLNNLSCDDILGLLGDLQSGA